jgi:hypothetical protein
MRHFIYRISLSFSLISGKMLKLWNLMWCVDGKNGGETTRHLILFIFSVLMLEPLKYGTENQCDPGPEANFPTKRNHNSHVGFQFDLLGKKTL